jgi:hypothetical protein
LNGLRSSTLKRIPGDQRQPARDVMRAATFLLTTLVLVPSMAFAQIQSRARTL